MIPVINSLTRYGCRGKFFYKNMHKPRILPSAIEKISMSYTTLASNSASPISAEKMDSKKVGSVVVPLGSQKVYVPSTRLAEIWKEKIYIIQKYLTLPPREKEFKLMELSLRKFYRSQNATLHPIQTKEDLENIFRFICDIAKQNKITPIHVTHSMCPEETDFITSISATINKYFSKQDFASRVKIQSVTEYFWYYALDENYIFPFTAEREDLHTMVQMALPYLDEMTLYHEVGAGSGEGLIEVLYNGYITDKMPGSIVGTDINPYSLESIKLLVEEEFGGLDNIYLRYGNAADSLNDVPLSFTPKMVMVGANRFFSILDPKVFDSILGRFQQQIGNHGYLVAGITVNSKRNLQQAENFNIKRYPDKYSLEECEYGMVLYQKNPFQGFMEREGLGKEQLVNAIHEMTGLPKNEIDISKIVRQIYYDPDKFKTGVERHFFEMVESKTVLQALHDEREVVLFKTTGLSTEN